MDDPASILRCTNKVYLADLLGCRQLGMPLTEISTRNARRTGSGWPGAWASRWC